MDNSKIEWTDHTWNPWMGCHKVSDACTHCYIGPVLKRAGKVKEPFQGPCAMHYDMAKTSSLE